MMTDSLYHSALAYLVMSNNTYGIQDNNPSPAPKANHPTRAGVAAGATFLGEQIYIIGNQKIRVVTTTENATATDLGANSPTAQQLPKQNVSGFPEPPKNAKHLAPVSITASSWNAGNEPHRLLQHEPQDSNSKWTATVAGNNQWIDVNFGKNIEVDAVDMIFPTSTVYNIEIRDGDGNLVKETNNSGQVNQFERYELMKPVETNRVQIIFKATGQQKPVEVSAIAVVGNEISSVKKVEQKKTPALKRKRPAHTGKATKSAVVADKPNAINAAEQKQKQQQQQQQQLQQQVAPSPWQQHYNQQQQQQQQQQHVEQQQQQQKKKLSDALDKAAQEETESKEKKAKEQQQRTS